MGFMEIADEIVFFGVDRNPDASGKFFRTSSKASGSSSYANG